MADEKPTEIQAEAAFIESFSTRLDKGEVGVDRGRVKLEREAAGEQPAKPAAEAAKGKTTPAAAADTAAAGTSSETGKSDEPAKASDEAEGGKPDTEDTGKKPAEGEGEDKPDAKKPKEGEEVDDKDDVDEVEPEESELAKEARAELAKHGLKMTLDDVPKEARALVKTKLDNMVAGYTRAMMEQRAYRKEESTFRAEQQFMAEHPELAIVELIHAHPEIEEKINELLTEASTDTGKKALQITTRDTRAATLKAIEDEAASIERDNARADVMNNYVLAACTKLNLPYEVVVAAVVNRLNEKPADKRDLTEDELDGIIGRQQLILRKHTGDKRREQRKEEIRGRTDDRKTTSPAAKAGAGGIVAPPAGKPAPKNDEEFAEQFAAKMSGAGR